MVTRQNKILSCIDFASQVGLEIGALNKPIVTPDMGNIRYVDHASTEDLKQKYANDLQSLESHQVQNYQSVQMSGLPDTDFPMSGAFQNDDTLSIEQFWCADYATQIQAYPVYESENLTQETDRSKKTHLFLFKLHSQRYKNLKRPCVVFERKLGA